MFPKARHPKCYLITSASLINFLRKIEKSSIESKTLLDNALAPVIERALRRRNVMRANKYEGHI